MASLFSRRKWLGEHWPVRWILLGPWCAAAASPRLEHARGCSATREG
jgi:hypothetical protein